jgi:hypothetical protein
MCYIFAMYIILYSNDSARLESTLCSNILHIDNRVLTEGTSMLQLRGARTGVRCCCSRA